MIVALVALASAALAVAQDPCPPASTSAQLITPPAGTIPRDAGFVVAANAASDLGGAALRPRRRTVPLTSERIAPGLFRLAPLAGTRVSGTYTVDGIAGTPSLVFGRPGRPAPPTAPALARLERYIVAGTTPRTEIRAHFDFPLPVNVIAVVSYWGDDTPDLFVRSAPLQSSLVLYSSSSSCALPAGASAPPEDVTSVRVAFVDLYGQRSELSEPRPIR